MFTIGGCAIILMIAAIAILVVVCTSHMGQKYIVSASLLVIAEWFVLQGMMDVNNRYSAIQRMEMSGIFTEIILP